MGKKGDKKMKKKFQTSFALEELKDPGTAEPSSPEMEASREVFVPANTVTLREDAISTAHVQAHSKQD